MREKASPDHESRWALAMGLAALVSFVAWVFSSFAVSNLVLTLHRLAGKLHG